jgi:GAF domain-containing protein
MAGRLGSKAQADDELRRLVRQKAGLTRVATIVAEGVPAAELFNALTQEVVEALEVPAVSLVRYEADGSTVVLASLNAPDFPVGRRMPLDGDSLSATVLETGRPRRVESELRSAVGVPIVVDGEVWGLVRAGATCPEPLPADIEAGLRDFTELVATAISKTESRESLRRVVAEQAALRNVATLVAEGAAPAEVFSSVAQEVARVLDMSAVSIVRFESDTWSVVVASVNDPGFPAGSRWPLQGPSLNATVFSTGQPAQIDYSELPGPVAAAARSAGLRVGVGVPIVVEGRVWGMIAVGRRHRRDALPAFAGSYSGRIVLSTPSPQETQARLVAFTELVATAISKAQAHDDLSGLALEQAALRRVATLVARDAPPGEVFDAVAMEVGTLLDTDITVVGRYDGDGAATAIGSWSAAPGGVPVGTRSLIGGRNVLSLVAETARPARVDGYDDASGEAADIARRHGWSSSIAAPIIVEGRLWGVMLVATQRPEPFPAGAEERLAAFTDLVATALANAQAHDEVRRFGEEQAALGRVATLVAAGTAPEQVFAAVVDESSSLLGLERIEFVRYESDNTGTVIAASGDHPFPTGSTWSLEDPSVMATVARTRRTARIDDYAALKGEIARTARSAGFQSAIGAPLTVEGHLWGVIIAISTDPEPIPERSEARLAQFTELVATAVANADSRDALARLADEQAALRRVATLVAEVASPHDLFEAVAEEVGRLFPVGSATMGRFEADDSVTTVASWSSTEVAFPTGGRWPTEGTNVAWMVLQTAEAARIDDFSAATDPIGVAAREAGMKSAVGSPIVVEGHLWGVITATSTEGPLPPDTEARLATFTELVATAIANANSRDALAELADEQAALRRVATLVAQGVQPDAIFAAVGEEIGRLFGSSLTTVGRFEPDAQALVAVGLGSGNKGIPLGSRWELDDVIASGQVFRTGHSARVDEVDWSEVPGPLAPFGRRLGVASTVASPIFVEGRLWGAVSVSDDKPLPPGAEKRLEKFGELIATAIANAESKSELDASRRRIVAAADDARRRIERDLHDGIQQRLIALSFRARAMTRRPPDELPGLATELAEGLKDTSDELREVSRGIHPTILTEAGLGPALRALARRSDIPVEVDVSLDERLPEPIEAAAYYIASESLTNVAKHAHANVVRLIAAHDNGLLRLEVRDDGAGGVDAGRGSGILGLTDRVEALGGTISITSPLGHGTAVAVELPIATSVTP